MTRVPRRSIAWVAIMIGLGSFLIAPETATAGLPWSDPESVYNGLVFASEQGDVRSREAVEQIDAYLATHGLSVDDLGTPTRVDGTERYGIQQFRTKSIGMWELRVVNETSIGDAETFKAYRSLRHGAVQMLAMADGSRTIQLVLSPNDRYSVDEFMAGLQCVCTLDDVYADVFVGDEWLMSVGGGFHADTRDGFVFASKQLLGAAASTLDLYPAVDPTTIQVSVRHVTVSLAAGDAPALIDNELVLIADPLTDTHDMFADRAASVRISNTPDVFKWYAESELGLLLSPGPLTPKHYDSSEEGCKTC